MSAPANTVDSTWDNNQVPTVDESWSAADETVVATQLGRQPRGVAGVAWRCPWGKPGVVMTYPRLPDGRPFPTTYYLTCPRAVTACSALESEGIMAEMTARLAADESLAARYLDAHIAYLAKRAELGEVSELGEMSAGGMPTRIKCLHALVGHALAAGPGVNPIGDEALVLIGAFWEPSCVSCGADLAEVKPNKAKSAKSEIDEVERAKAKRSEADRE